MSGDVKCKSRVSIRVIFQLIGNNGKEEDRSLDEVVREAFWLLQQLSARWGESCIMSIQKNYTDISAVPSSSILQITLHDPLPRAQNSPFCKWWTVCTLGRGESGASSWRWNEVRTVKVSISFPSSVNISFLRCFPESYKGNGRFGHLKGLLDLNIEEVFEDLKL